MADTAEVTEQVEIATSQADELATQPVRTPLDQVEYGYANGVQAALAWVAGDTQEAPYGNHGESTGCPEI